MSVSSNRLDESFRKLLQEEVTYDDESHIDDDEEFPTKNIRVLLVDADSNYLLFMKNLMTQFSYQVTKYESGEEAISFLMKSKHEIDLVIWDFHMPNINGLDALNTIVKEMDLPVVIMSHDHRKETVMKSTKDGACDFLVKPASKEVIAVLWQHVFRKRMSKFGLDKPDKSDADDDELYQSNEECSKNTSDQKGDKPSSKKPRMTWTPELHHKFEVAVEKIGSLEKAYPKQILKCMQEEMNVQGLTRNNVASHLQKYRLNSNKKTHTPQETKVDFGWSYARSNAALAASNPLLNSSINHHARGLYQAAVNAPIQYTSSSYLPVNNNDFVTNNLPYFDNFQPPQQQYYSSLQLPSVLTKQELRHMPSAMENSGQLIYNTNLPYDYSEYFPPGLNFD